MRAKVLNEPADYAKIARVASIPSGGEANTRETSAPRSGNQFFALSNLATDHVAGRTALVGTLFPAEVSQPEISSVILFYLPAA
jgi:hypothetical protein